MSSLTVNANELLPWSPDIDQRRKAKPGIISGTNFIDDLDGPVSYFSSNVNNFNFWNALTRGKVNELRLTDEIVYGTQTGIWRINKTNGEAELLLSVVVTDQFWPWTVAYVGGLYYFAQYNIGLWQYDQTNETLAQITIPGNSNCRGIIESFGRLVYLTDDRAGFSALDDGTDLTPSITTGATQQALSIVGGTAYSLQTVPDGWVVYTSNGIMKATFTLAAYVFTYKKLTDAVKVFSPNACIYIDLFGTIALDGNGFSIIQFAENTTVPVPWEIEKSDYIKKNLLNILNRNLNGTIGMYYSLAENKLFVSFSDNSREGVMIVTFEYTLTSQKWGSFDQQHTGIFDILDPTDNTYFCGYMATDGFMREFTRSDFSQSLPPAPAAIEDYLFRLPSSEPPVKASEVSGLITQTGYTNINLSDNIPSAYNGYTATGLFYMNPDLYFDSIPDSEGDPTYDGATPDTGLCGINIFESGGLENIAFPYELPKIGLNSILEVGPFRYSDQAYADETSNVATLIVGIAQTSDFTITEDWNLQDGTVDWNVENGAIDWGSGLSTPNTFDLALRSANDGVNEPIQGDDDLMVFNNLGSSLQYDTLGYSGIYHNLTFSALAPGQSFALKYLDFTGQLTGRLLNQ